MATIACRAKHKAIRGQINVGDTGKCFFFFTFFLLFNKKYWQIWQNGKNDNFATIAYRAKQKAMREPIKVGDTGKFGKYGNFVTIANRVKHKVMREPIKVGDTGKFGKYRNFATIANRAKHKAMREPIKVGGAGKFVKYEKKKCHNCQQGKEIYKPAQRTRDSNEFGKIGGYGNAKWLQITRLSFSD